MKETFKYIKAGKDNYFTKLMKIFLIEGKIKLGRRN
jgi:hypothetical protein